MSKQKDGGAAFPVFDSYRDGSDYWCPDVGMSLRDWFAGQALAGCELGMIASRFSITEVATNCYLIADAMIAEGEKQND